MSVPSTYEGTFECVGSIRVGDSMGFVGKSSTMNSNALVPIVRMLVLYMTGRKNKDHYLRHSTGCNGRCTVWANFRHISAHVVPLAVTEMDEKAFMFSATATCLQKKLKLRYLKSLAELGDHLQCLTVMFQ